MVIGDLGKMCKEQRLEEGIEVLDLMDKRGIGISRDNIYCVLQECSKKKDLAAGRRLYSLSVRCGLSSIAVLGDHFIRLFANCGSLQEANEAFCNVLKPSVYTWSAIISAHANLKQAQSALDLYHRMQQWRTEPDKVTFLCVLKACSSIGAIKQGRAIHEKITKLGIEADVVAGNTIVDMYSKCGNLIDARKVFEKLSHRSLASWSAMIAAYVQHGYVLLAIELFNNMEEDGFKPCNGMFLCILKACSSTAVTEKGMLMHDRIIRDGLESDLLIGSTLVDMYAKCGHLEEAQEVFGKLPKRNIVSWGALIAGYAQHGHGTLALELFVEMQQEGIQPDKVMLLSIFKACSSLRGAGPSRLIHDWAITLKIHSDLVVGNTLIDMYAKCGSLDMARRVFDELPIRNMITWGAMISGYAWHGEYRPARQCLENMQQQGFEPDDGIFASILTACSHAGVLEEGRHHFKTMVENNGIEPNADHYNCMIDLLGRVGALNEAADLLYTMPIEPDVIGWRSLLTGCRTYGNIDLGRQCFDQVVQLNWEDASGYVLMSNIYADACMWEGVDNINELRMFAAATKQPGKAWIETSNKMYEFIAGTKSDLKSDKVSAKLKSLGNWIAKGGYVSELELVLE